jgi:hypothetical protein
VVGGAAAGAGAGGVVSDTVMSRIFLSGSNGSEQRLRFNGLREAVSFQQKA